MNPRKRRGLLLMLVAAIVAAVTFVILTSYTANVNSRVGSRVTVYEASRPIDAYEPLGANNLKAVEVPERWASKTTILTMSQLQGRRVGFPISAGTTVSSDMLVPPSDLSSTEREIAINVDPVTGVAGRVRPGDKVDIYAVFGSVAGLPKEVKVLVRGVRVVTIAGKQTVTEQTTQGATAKEVVPVTLALEPEDALAVTYASAFADQVRLVALPNDRGVNRKNEKDTYDATELGGKAVPEEGQS